MDSSPTPSTSSHIWAITVSTPWPTEAAPVTTRTQPASSTSTLAPA